MYLNKNKRRYLTERLGKNCHFGAYPGAPVSISWNQLSGKIVSQNNFFKERLAQSGLTGPFAEDRKMKTQKLAAMLLTLALSFGASQGALAHECSSAIDVIRAEIAAADDLKDRDRTALDSKAYAADLKLGDDKPYDALKKLDNIRTKVIALRDARKTKIDDDDANTILDEVYNAEVCIYGTL